MKEHSPDKREMIQNKTWNIRNEEEEGQQR